MTDHDDRSPDKKAADRTRASVLEAMGTLMGDDGARRDGAKRKQDPDADPDAGKDLPDAR
ncbi:MULTISPECIES: hypothetical protein [Sphingomonas]|jgi:hypothetical protein|uniref:Uncharacterized protein n=1 Tax=Sphingomonas hankookensis TaxID=563996 RepID=A0ABR5Y8C8_9SPHN|nr:MULTISPECIES: hypothetical protein [Sphingomonas]KZE08677.1 hypothetical protein AVT10_07745 [Sphingomonas hankookensis]PZT91522.1 MAG: hypothetical protein DI625_15500 [Sphingomonas sp.]RSV24475.1 hypothetical protein CA237_13095 [Sphingomonas sp. ABOLH]WCP74005.1 hypothetical protein PPZ50_18720 [Sphingomonas hankookensis]